MVILGGGYGGIYTALDLQKAARRGRIHLSLISEENYFLAHPMLAEVVSGSIEPPHIVNPIRRISCGLVRMPRHRNLLIWNFNSPSIGS